MCSSRIRREMRAHMPLRTRVQSTSRMAHRPCLYSQVTSRYHAQVRCYYAAISATVMYRSERAPGARARATNTTYVRYDVHTRNVWSSRHRITRRFELIAVQYCIGYSIAVELYSSK